MGWRIWRVLGTKLKNLSEPTKLEKLDQTIQKGAAEKISKQQHEVVKADLTKVKPEKVVELKDKPQLEKVQPKVKRSC